MKNYTYFGNSAYCYSNSTAMLLASIGENIAPSLIEVLGGVGIGAYALPNSHVVFLSWYSGLPDKAISRAMKVLGFEFVEKAKESPNNPPFEEIKAILKTNPVVLGPLDMGYLTYNPNHKHLYEVDHFVFAYSADDNQLFLHDPAGFPNVAISLNDLEQAWKAEKIQYKEGYYRYWTMPKRIKNPTKEEIYKDTIKNLKKIYSTGEKYAKAKNKTIDYDAIILLVNNLEKELMSDSEIRLLTSFVFPLGARRASDFSDYFKPFNEMLSNIKSQQSKLLGLCYTDLVRDQKINVVTSLKDYAELEKNFKENIIKL